MFEPDLTFANKLDAAANEPAVEPVVEPKTAETEGEASPPEAKIETAGEGASEQDSSLQDILDELEVDSKDELRDAIQYLKDLKQKIGDKDPDDLLSKVKQLEDYEEQWAKEDEAKRLAEEGPEETLKRIMQENADLKKSMRETQANQKNEIESRKAREAYDQNISAVIERSKVSEESKRLARELLKSDTPIATVDINSKVAIRRMAEQQLSAFEAFRDEVIKNYISTKTAVAPVSKTITASSDAVGPPIKRIQEATKFAMSKFGG